MKIIIGVVGENGSGKDSFFKMLPKFLPNQTLANIRSSDILAETLKIWHLEKTRGNLQHLAVVMDEGFGPGTLTRAVKERIQLLSADVVVFDGMRWLPDLEMVRSFPKSVVVYVTADSKVRFQRTKNRGEKTDEQLASYEKFLAEQKARTEIDIPQIAASADVKIDNNGSLADLEKAVENFCHQHLAFL